MRDHDIWRAELFSEIRTIANADEIRRLWSGLDAHAISSFAEEVAHVFNDYDIDGFIDAGCHKAQLNLDQFRALRKFRNQLASCVDEMAATPLALIDHQAVLASLGWGEVTESAREFVALLDAQSA